jgi:DNA-binding GntR family transcriptional regulator/nicotinamidase-related amidase
MARTGSRPLPGTAADVLKGGSAALVLWDLQNGLAGQSPDLTRLSPVWARLRDAALEHGVLVVRSRHAAPRPDLMDDVERWRISRRTHGENRPERYMQPGGADTRFIPGFEPGAEEVVIEKTTPSLFHNTPADVRLRARGIRTLVLAGVATDIGIDFTARHAMALGYFPVVAEDAVGGFTQAAHEHAMAILRAFAFVAPSDEIIANWSRLPRRTVYCIDKATRGARSVTETDHSHRVVRASLADIVYERLRDEIMHGEIEDGSRLSQVHLAEKYGVSRIPIREALRRLQAESLVIATPYHPYVVRRVTGAQVLQLVDIRAALEDLALSQREPLTREEIAELRKINTQLSKGRDSATFLALDRKFHQLIEGPGTMVVEILDDVRDKVHKYMSSMVSSKPGRTTAAAEHVKLIDALEAKDMDLARQLMREHVMKSRDYIVSRLEAEKSKAK